uniref:RNA-binding motif, single-stranded-interacting protein 3 n=1 Tax=Schistocephalus solidus TaxID=70667 RepID=A0A0X3NPN2_SCHSO
MMTSKVPTGFRHASADLEFSKETYAVKDFRRSMFRRQTQSYTPILISKDAKRRQEVRNRSADLTSCQWTGQHCSPKIHQDNGVGFQRVKGTSLDASDDFSGLCVIDDKRQSPASSSGISNSLSNCQRQKYATKATGSPDHNTKAFSAFSALEPGKRADKDRSWEMTSYKRHREHGIEAHSTGNVKCLNENSQTANEESDISANSILEGSIELSTTNDSNSPNTFRSRDGTSSISKVAKTRAEENDLQEEDFFRKQPVKNNQATDPNEPLALTVSTASRIILTSNTQVLRSSATGKDGAAVTGEVSQNCALCPKCTDENLNVRLEPEKMEDENVVVGIVGEIEDQVEETIDRDKERIFHPCSPTIYEVCTSPYEPSSTNQSQTASTSRPNSLLPRPWNSFRKQYMMRSKRHSSRTNLYIRGLPKSMSENDLINLVPDASAIRSVKLVVNNDGEGYGFIDFVSNEAAVYAMHHIKTHNSNQYVNFAYESEKDPLNVYVTNIPESWSSENVENLKQIFAPYGKITSALVMTRRSTNTCTGTGFVRYLTSEEAQKAIDGIRKAKITLPGAKRPLELKLADRQRTREHKSEFSADNTNLPLFQQLTSEEQVTANRIKGNCSQPIVVPDIFAECAKRFLVNNAIQNLDPPSLIPLRLTGELDMNVIPGINPFAAPNLQVSSNSYPATSLVSTNPPPPAPNPLFNGLGKEHLRDLSVDSSAQLPVFPVPSLTPVYPLACIPWLQEPFIHPQSVVTPPKSGGAQPMSIDASPMAFNCGINQSNLGCSQLPLELMMPLLNNVNARSFDAGIYPYGLNQPLWTKVCFYG